MQSSPVAHSLSSQSLRCWIWCNPLQPPPACLKASSSADQSENDVIQGVRCRRGDPGWRHARESPAGLLNVWNQTGTLDGGSVSLGLLVSGNLRNRRRRLARATANACWRCGPTPGACGELCWGPGWCTLISGRGRSAGSLLFHYEERRSRNDGQLRLTGGVQPEFNVGGSELIDWYAITAICWSPPWLQPEIKPIPPVVEGTGPVVMWPTLAAVGLCLYSDVRCRFDSLSHGDVPLFQCSHRPLNLNTHTHSFSSLDLTFQRNSSDQYLFLQPT